METKISYFDLLCISNSREYVDVDIVKDYNLSDKGVQTWRWVDRGLMSLSDADPLIPIHNADRI